MSYWAIPKIIAQTENTTCSLSTRSAANDTARVKTASVRFVCNRRPFYACVDVFALLLPVTNHTLTRAWRVEMTIEEVTAETIGSGSTFSLLRIRVRNVRSTYERLWLWKVDDTKEPFLYDLKEDDGEECDHVRCLKPYISECVRCIEEFRAIVKRTDNSNSLWKQCNKPGGDRKKIFEAREIALVPEQVLWGACTPTESNTGLNYLPRILYPACFANDVARIQRDLDAESRMLPRLFLATRLFQRALEHRNERTWNQLPPSILISWSVNMQVARNVISRNRARQP